MKKLIFFFAAMSAFFSCAKESQVDAPVEETFSVEIKATAPSDDDSVVPANVSSKTTLVDGGTAKKFVHWSKGDAIKVLFFPNPISVNASFSGPNGIFTSHFDEETSSNAFFRCDSWSWGSKVEELGISKSLTEIGIAVYPATATAKSTKPSGTPVICDTEVSFVLPSTQTAVKDNIESNLNFSYATVELSKFQSTIFNGAQTDLKFNNACAMIELTMPSTLDKKVTSISIVSNTDLPLTGKGVARMTYYKDALDTNPKDANVDYTFKADVTGGAGVELNNSEGFKAGEKYYAVVWPAVHNSGLTIKFKAEDGAVATKTTGAVTLEPSRVKPYTFNNGLDFIAQAQEFDYVYSDGTVGNEVKNNVVGVIFFNGDPSGAMNDPDLAGKYTNGLAIGLNDHTIYWGTSSNTAPNWKYPSSVGLAKGNVSNYNVGGFSTKNIWLTNNYTLDIYTTNYGTLPSSTSGWYLAAPIEWKYIVENLSEINAKLAAVGAPSINLGTSISDGYWLPLAEANNYDAYVVHGPVNSLYFDDNDWTYKYSTHKSRPIFAF